MTCRVVLLALFAIVIPVASGAEALPDSQTLRDRSDAAYGPVPDAYRETIEFSRPGTTGKRSIYRRGADRREIDDTGAIHNEFGISKGDRWHENANGHVVIDQSEPGLATKEQMTTTVTHVTSPIDAYVIATLNAKGFGTRDYIDPKTSFVVRRETLAPNGKTITDYSDFRPFGARRLAAHWTVHDETTGTDTQNDVRDYVAGDVAESDVAMPDNRRVLVTYPAGQNRVTLPAVFEPDGHILVRLTIAGRGLDFILDTGASTITIDPAVAASLNLTVVDKMQSSVNAGRYPTGLAIVPEIGVGPLTMHDTVVSIVPLALELPGAKVMGLLGFDFICESGITIDYDHKTVTAERYGTYTAPQDPRTIALDVRLGTQGPLATVAVDGAVAERMLIDTGAAGPFMLFDYFTRRHPEALPPHRMTDRTLQMQGAGGAFEAQTVDLDNVQIGNVKFAHFEGIRVTTATSYSGNEDGVIGPTFLRFFDVHLDYPDGKIFLVPNATGHQSMH
jgi:predicted aspartyl protease